jgi:hypothetical protein
MTSVFDTHPRLSFSNSLQNSGNNSLVANIFRYLDGTFYLGHLLQYLLRLDDS